MQIAYRKIFARAVNTSHSVVDRKQRTFNTRKHAQAELFSNEVTTSNNILFKNSKPTSPTRFVLSTVAYIHVDFATRLFDADRYLHVVTNYRLSTLSHGVIILSGVLGSLQRAQPLSKIQLSCFAHILYSVSQLDGIPGYEFNSSSVDNSL